MVSQATLPRIAGEFSGGSAAVRLQNQTPEDKRSVQNDFFGRAAAERFSSLGRFNLPSNIDGYWRLGSSVHRSEILDSGNL
jgi:hypothetical protein